MSGKTLMLGAFQSFGLGGSWRLSANRSVDFLQLEHWVAMAIRLDQAGVDFLFFADDYSYPVLGGRVIDAAIEQAVLFPRGDPSTILAALALVTERLGLVVTSSTTAEKPQVLAKRLATLDHLTRGRIGWNVVAGSGQNASAKLFGEKVIAHDDRYAVADEHVNLTMKLWEASWEEDALVVDKDGGVYADSAKVHEIQHDGEFFTAHGLLTVPPSPQRTPVLFQAGTSPRGRDLASRYAEAVFLAAEVDMMATQIADIKVRAEQHGRSSDAIKFMPAGTFIVAETESEARALRERMIGFQTLEAAAAAYAFFTGIDLMSMDLDRPMADTRTEQGRTNVERFSGEGGKPALTVRQILDEFRRNGVMGEPFIGTPEQVVDQAEAVIATTGADGFLVQPDPNGGYDDFIDLVMPEMRKRHLLNDAPAGPTLRERIFGNGHARLPDDHPGHAYVAG